MQVLLGSSTQKEEKHSGHRPRSESQDVDDIEDEDHEIGEGDIWSDEEEEEAEGEEEDFGSYSEDYNREASRFLDDELGIDTPVQVERRERIVEGMKFEDIVPGIQLRVSPNSAEKYAHIMPTLGRIGVVSGIFPVRYA